MQRLKSCCLSVSHHLSRSLNTFYSSLIFVALFFPLLFNGACYKNTANTLLCPIVFMIRIKKQWKKTRFNPLKISPLPAEICIAHVGFPNYSWPHVTRRNAFLRLFYSSFIIKIILLFCSTMWRTEEGIKRAVNHPTLPLLRRGLGATQSSSRSLGGHQKLNS